MNVNEVIYIQYKFKWRQEHKLEKKKMINDVEIGTRTEIGTGTERSVTIIFFRLKTCRATLFVIHRYFKDPFSKIKFYHQ